jgi:hypothetical protein
VTHRPLQLRARRPPAEFPHVTPSPATGAEQAILATELELAQLLEKGRIHEKDPRLQPQTRWIIHALLFILGGSR